MSEHATTAGHLDRHRCRDHLPVGGGAVGRWDIERCPCGRLWLCVGHRFGSLAYRRIWFPKRMMRRLSRQAA